MHAALRTRNHRFVEEIYCDKQIVESPERISGRCAMPSVDYPQNKVTRGTQDQN